MGYFGVTPGGTPGFALAVLKDHTVLGIIPDPTHAKHVLSPLCHLSGPAVKCLHEIIVFDHCILAKPTQLHQEALASLSEIQIKKKKVSK